MKKFTLFAAFAALAVSASAQYTCETPYADQSVVAGETQTFDVVLGAEDVITGLKGAGQVVNDWRVNDVDRFLYVWENTFSGGDGSYPGVGYSDMQFDGYSSLTVGSAGWSGAGFFFSAASGTNTMHWNENTKFHIAVRTAAVAPPSLALIIADGLGNSPAKVALGESFNDGGSIYPTIGPKLTDEWVGTDISFADLKKLYPAFAWVNAQAWEGNMLSILAGGVTGQNISLDCMYFHTPTGDNAVGSVVDDAQWVITNNTVNVANGNGIVLYDLSGRMIKSVSGTTLGIDDVHTGVYVVKSGNSVKKIMK